MKPSWLAMNEHRAFPFVEFDGPELDGPRFITTLPQAAIVDFACILGPDVTGTSVHLLAISRVANTLHIDFTGDGNLAGSTLTFAQPINAPEFSAVRAMTTEQGVCSATLKWEGSLVTGDLSGLAALIADGETLTAQAGALVVEPTCVRITANSTVTSINLANRISTLLTPATGCSAPPPVLPAGTIVASAGCLIGDIRLTEGYNCRIAQSAPGRTITLSAVPGAGAGVSCSDVRRYPGEIPAAGSIYLSGGPTCGELVSSINGVSTSALQLVAGTGVTLTIGPAPNTLMLAVDGSGMAGCS